MKFNRTFNTGMVLALVSLCGCATIVSHSNWPVTFNSYPSGAEVIITDSKGLELQKGQTPFTLTLKSGGGYFKSAHYNIEVKMNGYTTTKLSISGKFNGWYIGNFVFGGLIGLLAVDPATGSMWRLPEQCRTTLQKGIADTSEPTLQIVSLGSIPEELRSKLVRIQ